MLLLTAVVPALIAAGHLGLAIRRRPQYGVLLLVALVPFNGLLIIVPHPGLLNGWKEALVLATAAAAAGAPAAARRPAGGAAPDWLPALLGLLLLGLVSAALVGGTQAVVGLKINYFYALLVAVLWRCPFDARDRDRLVTILMVDAVLTAVVGLVQQVVGGAVLHDLGYEYDTHIRTAGGVLRSFSTFNQPFPFALFLMLALLIGLPVALTDLRRPRNRLFLAMVPVVAIGMGSSIVRAALAATAVGLAFLAVHRYRVLLHGGPPVVVVAVLVPASVYAALLSADSLKERIAGWTDVIGQVAVHPLGNGIGATGSASEKATAVAQGVVASAATSGYQPDNYYVKMLLELGPLGLWLFLLLLLGAFVTAVRASRAGSGADAALAAGIAATVLGAAMASMVATYFEIFPLDVLFWISLGVLTSLPCSPSTPWSFARTAAGSRPTGASSSGP